MKRLTELLNANPGFTVLELVMVILLISILAATTANLVKTSTDAQRFEQTRTAMDAITNAILGDRTITKEGHRVNFGFVGDWGSLPTSVNDLVNPLAPAWTYDSVKGFGVGWRGPYYTTSYNGLNAIQDAWGHNFGFNGVTQTLNSLGSDGAPGGTGFAEDLIQSYPTNQWQSTVYGFVMDGSRRVPNATVTISYPSVGSMTTKNATSGANGEFTLTAIPMGLRAIAVTSVPTLGPKQIIVDTPQYLIPNDVLNYFGYEKLTYVNGSTKTALACGVALGTNTICATINSNYVMAVTLKSISLYWDQAGMFLGRLDINGTSKLFTPASCVASGVTTDISASLMSIPANTGVTILMTFYSSAACVGTPVLAAGNKFYFTQVLYTTNSEVDGFTIYN